MLELRIVVRVFLCLARPGLPFRLGGCRSLETNGVRGVHNVVFPKRLELLLELLLRTPGALLESMRGSCCEREELIGMARIEFSCSSFHIAMCPTTK